MGSLACQKRGGVAHVEPVGQMAGSLDLAQHLVQPSQLLPGHPAVGLVGGKEVGHHALQPQRRPGSKARQQREPAGSGATPWRLMPVSISRCTGNRAGHCAGRARSAFQFVQLPRLPGHGGQPVAQQRLLPWPGKTPQITSTPRLGAQRAGGHALLDAGHAQPAGTGADHGGRAESRASGRRHRP